MSETGDRRPFIAHLHAFRGFAIFCVVLVHAFDEAILRIKPGHDPDTEHVLDAINTTLFHGATIYFALISGVLYSTALKGRSWAGFFRAKSLHVLLPYGIVTVVLSAVVWQFDLSETPLPYGRGPAEFLRYLWHNILTGGAMYHLWYIPVLALLYVATPALAAAFDAPRARWLIVPIVLAPLVCQRVWPDFSWHNVVYFLGVYGAGIFIGRDYDRFLSIATRHARLIVIGILIASALLLFFQVSGIAEAGPISTTDALLYIQKLGISAVTLVLLKRLEPGFPGWLNLIARYAFAIYFLHAVVISGLGAAANALLTRPPGAWATILLGLGLTGAALVVSAGITAAIKWVAGKRSRYLIGA